MKKVVCLLLVLCLSFAALVACSDDESGNTPTPPPSGEDGNGDAAGNSTLPETDPVGEDLAWGL